MRLCTEMHVINIYTDIYTQMYQHFDVKMHCVRLLKIQEILRRSVKVYHFI